MYIDKDQAQLLAHSLSVDIQNALSSLRVAEDQVDQSSKFVSVSGKRSNKQQKESLANQETQARTKEFYNFLLQAPSCFGLGVSQIALQEVVQTLCHASSQYHMYTVQHLQSQWLLNHLQKEIQQVRTASQSPTFGFYRSSPTPPQNSPALEERDNITVQGERFSQDMLSTTAILMQTRTLIPKLKIKLDNLNPKDARPLFSGKP